MPLLLHANASSCGLAFTTADVTPISTGNKKPRLGGVYGLSLPVLRLPVCSQASRTPPPGGIPPEVVFGSLATRDTSKLDILGRSYTTVESIRQGIWAKLSI